MKKGWLIVGLAVVLIGIGGGVFFMGQPGKNVHISENGLSYVAKVEGKDFYIYKDGEWKSTFLTGVNMGAAKPGTFPGELAITKEEYLRWFKQIKEMNADIVRVYTTLKPAFYEALYEFNENSKDPLYIMHGVYLNEENIAELNDAYANDEKIKKEFIQDATDLVNVLHGNAKLPKKAGFADGEYTKDISQYVVGWILGVEWDPYFVNGTNKANPDKKSFDGEYLYTKEASPFEVFLAEVGDEVLSYEAEEYQMIRPLSYTNWLTTDMLSHQNEPDVKEDMAIVNTEHIKNTEQVETGLFASYHVYPYYPDFLNYQPEYAEVKNEDGSINTYKAYLKDLIKEHSVPVMVAEFGIPASRGKAHESIYSGFNQGGVDETEQGKMLIDMMKDIHDEGYFGGLIFTWQDEWFKRTWNTMDFDLPDRRPFWSNTQTNEQHFGLLAFDSGDKKSTVYIDGDVSDWSEKNIISKEQDHSVSVKSDEKYVYVKVEMPGFDFNSDQLMIGIDVKEGQGNTKTADGLLKFSRPTDFLVNINGPEYSGILVDAYYDSYYYQYGEILGMIKKEPKYRVKDSGLFNPMIHALSAELALPQTKETIPFASYETGKLVLGDGNPDHKSYNSLTDFAVKDGNVEIAIPWQLLNVMDPSTKQIMGDLYQKEGIEAVSVEDIYFGAALVKKGSTESSELTLNPYSWEPWELPTYHERLKPSYYLLQEALLEYTK
ncbi:MAG: family 2 glycosyl transferase [Carnobacterium jeotgali]|uniref:family 2 glycosyl transferase n=1 Tax=Carnobacterium jeotgali TaxID=545534 RepID=UPI003C77CE3F